LQAALGLREVARSLEIDHTRLLHWEKTGRVPKAEFAIKLAELYRVGPEDILGLPKAKPAIAPNSKMAKLFAEASRLPGPQQRRIADLLEDIVTAQKLKAQHAAVDPRAMV
jgi:transcriptional regulator with XRE-family HTH domain